MNSIVIQDNTRVSALAIVRGHLTTGCPIKKNILLNLN